jgi:hypothetical protein
VQHVTNCRHDVFVQPDSRDQPRSFMEDCLQAPDDVCHHSVQDSAAVVDSTDGECLNDAA